MDCNHQGSSTAIFSARDYLSGEKYIVRMCSECCLTYTDISSDKAPITNEEVYPPGYYGKHKRYRFFFGKILDYIVMRRARLIGDIINRDSGSVLDIGCGQGLFLKQFSERGWQATGIEVSESAAYYAKEILGLNLLIGEQASEELNDESFDVISLWHVLEHVEHPRKLLTEAKRMLKKDGRLLVSVPNFGSIESRFSKDGWFHLDVPRHVIHFTEQTLSEMINDLDFKVLRKTYFTPEYDFFSFIQSLQNRMRLEMNLLYRLIRDKSLKSDTPTCGGLVQTALALLSAPILALLSLIYVPVAIAFKQGSSINLVLKKNHVE